MATNAYDLPLWPTSHTELMDNRLHQGKTDNRFWFRRVRGYQKRTELCVMTYPPQFTSSHIPVTTTEWIPSKLGAYYIYLPVINYLPSF